MSTKTVTRPTPLDSRTDKPPVAHYAHPECDEENPGGFCGNSFGDWIPAGVASQLCVICEEIDQQHPDSCPLCGAPWKRG